MQVPWMPRVPDRTMGSALAACTADRVRDGDDLADCTRTSDRVVWGVQTRAARCLLAECAVYDASMDCTCF